MRRSGGLPGERHTNPRPAHPCLTPGEARVGQDRSMTTCWAPTGQIQDRDESHIHDDAAGQARSRETHAVPRCGGWTFLAPHRRSGSPIREYSKHMNGPSMHVSQITTELEHIATPRHAPRHRAGRRLARRDPSCTTSTSVPRWCSGAETSTPSTRLPPSTTPGYWAPENSSNACGRGVYHRPFECYDQQKPRRRSPSTSPVS